MVNLMLMVSVTGFFLVMVSLAILLGLRLRKGFFEITDTAYDASCRILPPTRSTPITFYPWQNFLRENWMSRICNPYVHGVTQSKRGMNAAE